MQFKGDPGHSSWLQNEDLAFIYRAYNVRTSNPAMVVVRFPRNAPK